MRLSRLFESFADRLLPREAYAYPTEWHSEPTLKRRLNLLLNRYEHQTRRTRLHSRPWILSIEPTNACNLQCPFCFTGAGGIGRKKSVIAFSLFERLMEELGDYLILMKACGWGEPLLCGHLERMVRDAHARGIGTAVNTNFSFPFAVERAELLVESGLTNLIVSIDGATQHTYEQYRVSGNLARVIHNAQLLQDVKRRLGSPTPIVRVEYHPFPWNTGDATEMRKLASRLEADLWTFKGCVPGPEWEPDSEWRHCGEPSLSPCFALWSTAIVSSDGGVSPCFGTFYSGDDMGRIGVGELETTSFEDVWNNERFQRGRTFFRTGRSAGGDSDHVCFNCPNTILWERWQQHRSNGGTQANFDPRCRTNDTWNYFWNRRLEGARRHHALSAKGFGPAQIESELAEPIGIGPSASAISDRPGPTAPFEPRREADNGLAPTSSAKTWRTTRAS